MTWYNTYLQGVSEIFYKCNNSPFRSVNTFLSYPITADGDFKKQNYFYFIFYVAVWLPTGKYFSGRKHFFWRLIGDSIKKRLIIFESRLVPYGHIILAAVVWKVAVRRFLRYEEKHLLIGVMVFVGRCYYSRQTNR